ncbi:MAG: glycosyltransferase family 2 protein, partial [Geminicoccaceae bacterium]|nr:glycosyltransferase family 2 protein [Geminicoccaceae bacterium]
MTLLAPPLHQPTRERPKPSAEPVRRAGPLPFPRSEAACPVAPRISVLIPAHDAAQRLPRTLRSVQSQSVSEIEVIVVDDASRDRTAEVVEEIAARDPRVRLIRAERNLGPGGARNLALQAARAPWIALLDSDDTFLPGRLSRLLRYAEQTSADLVADNLVLRIDESEIARPMLPPALLDGPRWLDAATFVEGNLPIPGHPRVSYGFLKPVISRRFLERHGLGYRDGLRFAEDFDFYLRCLLAGGRWLLIPEAGYGYRVRGDSLTARHGAAELTRLRRLDRHALETFQPATPDPKLET